MTDMIWKKRQKSSLEARRTAIKATVKAAKAQERINKVGSSVVGASNSMDAFNKMEAKANKMLDEANAMAELNASAEDSNIDNLAAKYDAEPAKQRGKRESVSCQPPRKSLFWQTRSSRNIRTLQSVMKQIMVFSSGICLFLWMRLSLNLRSVRSIHTLSRQAMYCTIPINVRLMQNMFRCFLKLPRKERFRFRQSDWKRKKKRRMLRHRLQPMHCFITENMSRMSR